MTDIRDLIETVKSIVVREQEGELTEGLEAVLESDDPSTAIKDVLTSEEASTLAYFIDDGLFQYLVKDESEEIVEELKSLRKDIPNTILDIFKSDQLKGDLEKFREKALKEEQPAYHSVQVARNVITQVSGIPLTMGWMPVVRFTLANHKERRLLLDTTLDWDDIAFLTERLTHSLRRSFESSVEGLQKEDWDKVQEMLGTKYLDKLQDTIENLSAVLKQSRDIGLLQENGEGAGGDDEA